jgi:hypothetical protein
MSTTKTSREIPLDEIRRTLSGALGPAYTVTATSDSTLRIQRFPLVTATVKVSWQDDGTTLQAAPGEAWILQGINALTIYPKLRRTLAQAFTPAPGDRARA